MKLNRYLLANLFRRPACAFTGCHAEHPSASACDRCGAELYEEWIDASICDPLQSFWFNLTEFLGRWSPARRCDHCGGPLPLRRRFSLWPPLCSEKCEDEWIPF